MTAPKPTTPTGAQVPWIPNEAPALDAIFEALRRARATIDHAIADINGGVTATYWQGSDADSLRREWANQRMQLDALCVQIGRLVPMIQQRSQSESTRFRQQSTTANGGW
jgi:hypothetical protein